MRRKAQYLPQISISTYKMQYPIQNRKCDFG